MEIRRADKNDIERLLELLAQVHDVHYRIRPDIFADGITKYQAEDLEEILADDTKPVFVAADGNGSVAGYAFCQIKEQTADGGRKAFRTLYLDDICVDEAARGQGVGEALFEYVKDVASRAGCYEITLNVWAGNEEAERFYEKMGMRVQRKELELVLTKDL